MSIFYRRARSGDVGAVAKVFAEAIDDLDKRHGFFYGSTPTHPPNPLYEFALRKDPRAFWVAEDHSRVVGYTFSFLRGSLWFLADLFILPSYQGRGVGRNLIRRTLASWKGRRIGNRALITHAYNPSSVSLYMRFGMYPREVLYFASAPKSTLLRKVTPHIPRAEVEEATNLEDARNLLEQIDRKVLGFSLGWHHDFYFEQKAHCFIFKKYRRPVGYAYVRNSGRVGPVAVTASSFLGPAMRTAVTLATEGENKEAAIVYPGSNEEAVANSIKFGFRITQPMLYLSAHSMGIWKNYMPYSPDSM